jgi:hypothetical protein
MLTNLDSVSLMNYIGLNEPQKPKLTEAREKFEAKLVTLNTALQAATRQLVEAIVAGNCTPAKMKELSSNASKAEADVLQARVEFWGELKTLLNADQYAKLANQPQARFEGPVARMFMTPRTSGAPPLLPAGTPPPTTTPPATPPAP